MNNKAEGTFIGRDTNIFDFPHVRVTVILLYSAVFLVCFFGNLAVLKVITFHKRMRNAKNFIVGHLAAANLCVAPFCIYQSLSIYLIKSWALGSFLCKMSHFIISLSHATSVLLPVLTAIERYMVIIHPIHNRLLLTMRRKRLAVTIVWMLSALLSFHRFYYASLMKHHLDPSRELICTMDISTFNHKLADMLNFAFLFVFPLAVISSLYIRIAIFLRNQRASCSFLTQFDLGRCNRKKNNNNGALQKYREPFSRRDIEINSHSLLGATIALPSVLASALQARKKANRRAVKLLTVAAVSFAFCNLPFHLMKILENYSDYYNNIRSPWLELMAPLTFLLIYTNCAVSPFVHALLSENFHRSLAEEVMRYRNNCQGQQLLPLRKLSKPEVICLDMEMDYVVKIQTI